MSLFILIYLALIVLVVALVVTVFRRFRRRGALAAMAAGLLTLGGLGLLFPIPMHGGFTFPLAIIWGAWQQHGEGRDEGKGAARQGAFVEQLQQRFAARLHSYEEVREEGGWRELRLPQGDGAWLDSLSGLVWMAPRWVAGDPAAFSLGEATAFCRGQAPAGHWALPTEAELALLWQHGGQRWMPGTGHSSTALLVQEQWQIIMATEFRGRAAGFSLRCVALSEGAPRGGYAGSDIPLSLWNDYQLHKADIHVAGEGAEAMSFSQEMK